MDGVNGRVEPHLLKTNPPHRGRDRRPRLSEGAVGKNIPRPARPPTRSRMTARGGCKESPLVGERLDEIAFPFYRKAHIVREI